MAAAVSADQVKFYSGGNGRGHIRGWVADYQQMY